MRIVFDCRYIRLNGRHDGISRYTAGLVTALGARHPLIMLINDHRQLDLLPDLPWELVRSPTSPLEPLVARQVNRLDPDVVFSPMQTMGSLGRHYRLVLTVHDLIYYRHRTPPRDLPWYVRILWRLYHLAWWPQRMLLNRADAVATVSETTAHLIAEHHLTRRPVRVIANAADDPVPDADEPAEPRTAPVSRSLVYMGSFMPYKNVDTLVAAASRLPGYELHLLSAIPDPERERLTALAPEARLVFHNGVSDAEYRRLLADATALVHASLDEGFGIPLLEAMRAGTPVVVSDIPIFREVGADAAVYVDPHDAEGFAEAVRALEKPGAWASASGRGRERAADYTWEASAAELHDLLGSLADARADVRRP